MSDERYGSVWCRYWHPIRDKASPPGWECYWDREPDGPPAMLEQQTGLATVEDAVDWGLARARRVYLMPMDEETDPYGGRPYWAGEGPSDEGLRPVAEMKRSIGRVD